MGSAPHDHEVPLVVDVGRPRRHSSLWIGVILAALGLGQGVAFVDALRSGADDEAVFLSVGFPEGARTRYRVTMEWDTVLEMAGSSTPLEATITQTVVLRHVSTDARGVATIALRVEDSAGEVNGEPLPEGAIPLVDTELQIASDGRVMSAEGSVATGPTGPAPGFDQFTPLLPAGPVEPGDDWHREAEMPFPFGDGTIAYVSDSRLDAITELEGVQSAVVKSQISSSITGIQSPETMYETLDIPAPAGVEGIRLSIEGTSRIEATHWLDLEAGRLLAAVVDADVDMITSPRAAGGAATTSLGEMRLSGRMTMSMDLL